MVSITQFGNLFTLYQYSCNSIMMMAVKQSWKVGDNYVCKPHFTRMHLLVHIISVKMWGGFRSSCINITAPNIIHCCIFCNNADLFVENLDTGNIAADIPLYFVVYRRRMCTSFKIHNIQALCSFTVGTWSCKLYAVFDPCCYLVHRVMRLIRYKLRKTVLSVLT